MHEFSPTFKSPSLNLWRTHGSLSAVCSCSAKACAAANWRATLFVYALFKARGREPARQRSLVSCRIRRNEPLVNSHALPKQLHAVFHLLHEAHRRLEP